MMRENPLRARISREHLVSIKKKTHLRKNAIFEKKWAVREIRKFLKKLRILSQLGFYETYRDFQITHQNYVGLQKIDYSWNDIFHGQPLTGKFCVGSFSIYAIVWQNFQNFLSSKNWALVHQFLNTKILFLELEILTSEADFRRNQK